MKQDGRPTLWMLLSGGMLLLVALAVMATNESNVLTYRAAAAWHGGIVENATQRGPTPGNEGEMVLVTGMPTVVKPAVDAQFDIRADVPILWRVTEMFQWHEVDYAGTTTYEMDWIDHRVDSSAFKHPARHRNPTAMPLGGGRYYAGEVRLDGFVLSPRIVAAMPGREPYAPDFSTLRPSMAASFRVAGHALVTSENPSSPQFGDLRVSWQQAPLQAVTVIARNQDGTLVPAEDVESGDGFELQTGQREIYDLQPDLPAQPFLPWVWRIVSLLITAVGAYALLRGVSVQRAGPLAAAGVAVALVCGLAGMMWVTNRGDVGGVLLGIAVLALGVTAWCMYERSPAE